MSEEDAAWYRGILKHADEFYDAKFDERGEIRPGWDYAGWTLSRVADIPRFGTRGCHTALSP